MDQNNDDHVRGSWLDWPALLAVLGLVMAAYFGSSEYDQQGGVWFGLLLAVFGGVTALARRGTFSARRD